MSKEINLYIAVNGFSLDRKALSQPNSSPNPNPSLKPTFSLWGSSADHCTTVLPRTKDMYLITRPYPMWQWCKGVTVASYQETNI